MLGTDRTVATSAANGKEPGPAASAWQHLHNLQTCQGCTQTQNKHTYTDREAGCSQGAVGSDSSNSCFLSSRCHSLRPRCTEPLLLLALFHLAANGSTQGGRVRDRHNICLQTPTRRTSSGKMCDNSGQLKKMCKL